MQWADLPQEVYKNTPKFALEHPNIHKQFKLYLLCLANKFGIPDKRQDIAISSFGDAVLSGLEKSNRKCNLSDQKMNGLMS
ncbi:hypothetical protein HHI36_021438 [Cryptolaemus montrouzieri]|uniref:Uncharacterized protein n=1 Tax=Cryptolaemus montrouzieri TaxID=559131 RepID=A0ABD2MXA0_9CUCU